MPEESDVCGLLGKVFFDLVLTVAFCQCGLDANSSPVSFWCEQPGKDP